MTSSKIPLKLESPVAISSFAGIHHPQMVFGIQKPALQPPEITTPAHLRFSTLESFLFRAYKKRSSLLLKTLRFGVEFFLGFSIVGLPAVFYVRGKVKSLKVRVTEHRMKAEFERKEKNQSMHLINARASLIEMIGMHNFENLRQVELEGRGEDHYAACLEKCALSNLSNEVSYRGLTEIRQAFMRLSFKKRSGTLLTLDLFEFSYPNPSEWKAVVTKKKNGETLRVKTVFEIATFIKNLLQNTEYKLLTP